MVEWYNLLDSNSITSAKYINRHQMEVNHTTLYFFKAET